MYTIELKPASKNGWHTPAEAKKYYKKYSRDGITVHWWNTPALAGTHDTIVKYILGKAVAAKGSVNYVVSDKKITLCVNPDNVAWASQAGNPTTISIEFDPRLKTEGYKKAGWLINELEKRYKKGLTLYPHKHWFPTACPGTLDLKRMRAEANKWKQGKYDPKPTPKPTPAKAKLVWAKLPTPTVYITNKETNLWDVDAVKHSDMKVVKTYKKGEKIKVYGTLVNQTVGSTYFVTEYSYSNKTPNGFNSKDLDVYVAPRPAPTPPVEQQPAPLPENPTKPVEPDYKSWTELLQQILDYLKGKM